LEGPDAGDAPDAGDEFVPGRTYRITKYRKGIAGDLGAFWVSELTFATDANGQPLVTAGPVAATVLHVPVRLDLRFANGDLTTVEAETAAGTYRFIAWPIAGN
jgi:hypothetical protein